MKTIIIAWITLDGMKATGEVHRPDGVNWQSKLEWCPQAHATQWLREGNQDDFNRAIAHAYSPEMAGKEMVKVYQFKPDENALDKARQTVLEEYKKHTGG